MTPKTPSLKSFFKGYVTANSRGWQGREILMMYEKEREEGSRPSITTVIGALKLCSSAKDLETGKRIHADVLESGDVSNIFVANTLLNMYAKCGSMVDAGEAFEWIPQRSVVSWNCIIRGYAQTGEGELALRLYSRMQDEGCAADRITFLAAIKACAGLAEKEEATCVRGRLVKTGCLAKGKAIHSQISKSGHSLDFTIGNTLIDLYAKCGSMADASHVFDKMPQHSVVSWTAIMLGYVECGEGEVALDLFERMQDTGCEPDARASVAVLHACASLGGCLERGKAIHSIVARKGQESDIYVASTLVHMYAKCESMVDAHRVFEKMRYRDAVAWNAIILGYANCGDAKFALELYARMKKEGCAANRVTFLAALKACVRLAEHEEAKEIDWRLVKTESLRKGRAVHYDAAKCGYEREIVVANALIDMYTKCGSMLDAREMFEKMPRHTLVSWTAIMSGYAESGEGHVALQLFTRLKNEGYTPNASIFVAVLKACGSSTALESGKKIHIEIRDAGLLNDTIVATSLVDFYGKCGCMADAQKVFDTILAKDIVSWSALIAGYSRQGDATQVFDLFDRMQRERLRADDVTFLSILTVCTHGGLVDKGKEYFNMMCIEFGLTPRISHYICMVDLLGRSNQLEDAVAMVKAMPVEPSLIIWTTILDACCKWTNVTVGRLAFDSVMKFDDANAAAFVLMANIYARAGLMEDSAKILAMRK